MKKEQMKARDILLGEGLSNEDIQELKNQIEEVNYEYGDASKATDADALKEYYNQKSNRLQRSRQERPRKIEQTKEYIERSAMGGEDARSQAMRRVKIKEDDDLVSGMNKMTLYAMDLEGGRAKAMKQPKIEEKGVLDESDVYGNKSNNKRFGEAAKTTGVGKHTMFGETHRQAKLTNAQVNDIRKRWWVNKEKQGVLMKDYGVSTATLTYIVTRQTWSHLPQVEGEPDDVYNAPNQNDLKVMKRAKELGVEPVRNKIGRLKLPDGTIKAVRAAAKTEKLMKLKE
jgi:ketosteroid isomerase-like protein